MGVIHRGVALAKFTNERLGLPFAWGITDCNVVVLEWVDMLRGAHYLDEVRGRYKTEIGAVRFQKKHKFRMSDMLHQWGAETVPAGFEQLGDIVTVSAPNFDYCHIVLGRRLLSSGPEHGGVCLLPFAIEQDFTTWRLE